MRNLKKALSLALASVMLLGMMVVGTSAADFTDVDAKDNVEAIEVMQAAGIMIGDAGKFNPDKAVTRNEMAVIMTNLLDLDTDAYSGTTPFTDIPAWAEPFVAACYANGIVSGTSATTYGGDGGVTAAQAALMVMKALGYFQYASDFGTDWQLATVKQADKINLFKGIDAKVTATLTRNEAAQLVLNALKATMVEADDNGIGVNTEGTLVSKYKYVDYKVASGTAWAQKISTAQDTTDGNKEYVQLGEKLFGGKLELAGVSPTVDEMARPAHTWKYDGKAVGTYADTADETFVITKVDGTKNTLTAWLRSINEDYYVGTAGETDSAMETAITNTKLYVNNSGMTAAAYSTTDGTSWGMGDVVEVYENSTDANQIDKIIVTQSTLYEITKVDTDVNTADAKNDVKAYITLKNLAGATTTVNDTAIVGYNAETYIKGAYIAAVLSGANVLSSYVVDAPVEGVVTGYTSSKYTVGGKTYEKALKANDSAYTASDFESTYALYLDANGYILGVKVVEDAKVVTDAVYVLAQWAKTSTNVYNAAATKFYAQVVGVDGVLAEVVTGYTTTAGKIEGVDNNGFAYTAATVDVSTAANVDATHYYVNTSGVITQCTDNTVPTDAIGYNATPANNTTKFYTRASDLVTGNGKFFTVVETSKDYVELDAYADTTSIKMGTVGSVTTKTSKDDKFTSVSIDSGTKNVYFVDDTKFVIVEGTLDAADVTVKTGADAAFAVASANAQIIAKKVGNNYEAAYVVINTADYTGSNSSDVIYVNSATTTTVDGGKTFSAYDMDGNTVTIKVAAGASVYANTFYTLASVDSKGVYTLGSPSSLTVASANDWDEADYGVATNVKFVNLYNDVFTLNNGSYDLMDIEQDGLVIVDKHEKDQDEFEAGTSYDGTANDDKDGNPLTDDPQYTYAASVTTLAEMDAATEAGYTVTFSISVTEDGAEFIVIKEISK